ncbi:hypothetical protein HS088_TW17G00823 [Tripterygium wilfordii]|uniref:Vegetative cell wall protein gp1-like n=1 Tax=Tripterygium wilfordii TaxID=458696 RepID=A0A7J7CGX0_TRIWF|nr:oleosin-B6-like [Tripterygium wilfordii]KAF5733281.1 hypothetical protein HS088_TW17G00823 [Tripterygium wilfordii]
MATQQTPARPWFRLASIARQPAPQAPAAEPAPPLPRPPLARPTLRPVAQPQSQSQPTQTEPTPPPPTAAPQPPAPRAPASPAAPTSPTPKTASTTPTTVTARVPSPAQPSPRTLKPAIETPPQSPKPKPTAPPPSPLTLPPSQIKPNAEPESKSPPEAEQKDVLMQKTIEKVNDDTHKPRIDHTGKQGVVKEADTEEKAHRKKFSSSDTEEEGIRIITIAGENKGALMEVIKSPKKNGFEGLYKKGNPGGTSSDSSSEFKSYSSSEEEGNRNMKKDKKNRAMSMNSTPMSAFMNSNVQGVNNSVVFKSSCTHSDPGVHLALSRNPSNGGFHAKGRSNGYDS